MIQDRGFDRDELFRFLSRNADQFSSDLHGQIQRSGNGTLEQYSEKLSRKATIAYEKDMDKVTGMVIGYTHDLPEDGLSYITYVIVDKDYRGRGIMRRLLFEYEDHCRSVGIPAVWMKTGKKNITAQKAYEKCGYCCEGPDSERTLRYSKSLMVQEAE